MKKLKYLEIVLFLIITQSCSELFQTDEYHKLSSEQHFELTSDNEIILSHNDKLDTVIVVGIIKAEYQDELYTGVHCKGPYDYIEFERVYYALKKDTSLIEVIDEIKNPDDYYGYCRTDIPITNACIQFFFGYPKSSGQIKNAPVLTLNGHNYQCSKLLDDLEIRNSFYSTVYQYEIDSIEFKGIGTIDRIYMTKTDGIIKIGIVKNYNWERV
ncbi:MAG: hypothetical protein IMY72_04105 [Bacteroidetes bacterium]|nr:hypothetical protein [Bacteroidota bacterium]